MDFATRREKLLALTKKQVAESLSDDIVVIQALNAVDDLTTQINGMSKRLREWHGYFLPELDHAIDSNEHYVSLIAEKSYEELVNEYGQGMQAKVRSQDYVRAQNFALFIKSFFDEKNELLQYIESKLEVFMKNVLTLAGVTISARLLASAGSLYRLSRVPASTIQMYGAEKALFRHLRSGARSPKHGHIFNHPLVQGANRSRQSGKAARMLADKLSICAKVDYFKGEFVADEYKKELEAKWGEQ